MRKKPKIRIVKDFSRYDAKNRVLCLTKNDFVVEYTCGSGKGGQHRNRKKTAVRIKHLPSGQEAYCADERNQRQNQNKAFGKLVERMIPWIRREHAAALGNEIAIEERVEKAMRPGNIKVEVRQDGQWVGEDGTKEEAV